MSYRARITEDFAMNGVRVELAERTESGTLLRGFGVSDYFISANSGVMSTPETHRGLVLAHDEARALWVELSRYYNTNPPSVSDRSDLLAERARVDKLTDAVILIATRRTQPLTEVNY